MAGKGGRGRGPCEVFLSRQRACVLRSFAFLSPPLLISHIPSPLTPPASADAADRVVRRNNAVGINGPAGPVGVGSECNPGGVGNSLGTGPCNRGVGRDAGIGGGVGK